jgi:hypothetical protein
LCEVVHRAVQVLVRELGPADAARFLGQYLGGSGDYVRDREALFAGLTLPQLAEEIRKDVASRDADSSKTSGSQP